MLKVGISASFMHPDQPRAILIDVDDDLADRFVPVEMRLDRSRHALEDVGDLPGEIADTGNIRSADAVLDGPADRRPQLERRDTRHDFGKLLGERFLQLGLHPLARLSFGGGGQVQRFLRRFERAGGRLHQEVRGRLVRGDVVAARVARSVASGSPPRARGRRSRR